MDLVWILVELVVKATNLAWVLAALAVVSVCYLTLYTSKTSLTLAGSDDTYGDSTRTGGVSNPSGGEYGMGSGRRGDEGEYEYGMGSGRAEDDQSGGKKDSTIGKLMEKAGGAFKSSKLEERGAEKRREAGARDDY